MKTDEQIRNLIQNHPLRSQADRDMIVSFCRYQKSYIASVKVQYSETGMDVSQFTQWFNDGFGTGDIVQSAEAILILGDCTATRAHVIGSIGKDGLKAEDYWSGTENFVLMTGEDRLSALRVIARSGYQITSSRLVKKYIPHANDRVDFSNDSVKGVGVVREIDFGTGEVELYCYFLYKTKETAYSMHEKGICNLNDFTFTESTRGSQKRLSKELKKFGKEWNEKLHRIQPVGYKLNKGERYYAFNDKLAITSYPERNNFTSMCRRSIGNYFKTHEEAMDVAGKIHEILRNHLAE